MKGLKYLIELKDKLSGPVGKISDKVSKVLPKLDSLKAKMKGVNREGNNTGGLARFASGVGSLVKNLALAGSLAGVLSLGGIAAVGGQATQAAVEISNANRVIAFSEAGAGAQNLAFLDQTIRRLNLPIRETTQSFSEVAASFKDTKLQGQGMRDIFEGVSIASSAMSLGPEKAERVFRALSQIMSKGKPQAEEITGQLGEVLPNSLGIAARAMGVTKARFYELMSQGKIMSEDFLPAFAKELKKTFGEAAVQAAQLPQAAFTRWQNSVYRVKAAIGENLIPVLANLADKFGPMLEGVIGSLPALFDLIFAHINNLYNVAAPLLNVLFRLFHDLQVPVGYFIKVLYQVSQTLMGVVYEAFGSLLSGIDLGYILGGVFMALVPVLRSIGRLFEAIKPILNFLGRVAGFIINLLGKVALKVVEALAWGFVKLANGVSWVVEKITGLLSAVGLLNKGKATVGIEVNKPKDLFAGLRVTDKNAPASFGGFGTPTPEGVFSGDGSGSPAAKTIDNVAKGGSKPTNINIQLGSLISGGFTVQTTNLKEGADKVEEVVMSALLKVLNGANQVAGA